jgi:hypothetical protein
MSWREFMVLIRGLGPNSTLLLTVRSGGHRDRKGREVRTLTTTEDAERAFRQLFGPPPGQGKVQ